MSKQELLTANNNDDNQSSNKSDDTRVESAPYVALESPPKQKTKQKSNLKSKPIESTITQNKKHNRSSSGKSSRAYSIGSMVDGNRRKNKHNCINITLFFFFSVNFVF